GVVNARRSLLAGFMNAGSVAGAGWDLLKASSSGTAAADISAGGVGQLREAFVVVWVRIWTAALSTPLWPLPFGLPRFKTKKEGKAALKAPHSRANTKGAA